MLKKIIALKLVDIKKRIQLESLYLNKGDSITFENLNLSDSKDDIKRKRNLSVFSHNDFLLTMKGHSLSIEIKHILLDEEYKKIALFYPSAKIKEADPIAVHLLKETSDKKGQKKIVRDKEKELIINSDGKVAYNKQLNIQKAYNNIFKKLRQEALTLTPQKSLVYEKIRVKQNKDCPTNLRFSILYFTDSRFTLHSLYLSIEIKIAKINGQDQKLAFFYDSPQIKNSSPIAIWLLKETTDKKGKKTITKNLDYEVISVKDGYKINNKKQIIQKQYISAFRSLRKKALKLAPNQTLISEGIQVKEDDNPNRKFSLSIFSSTDFQTNLKTKYLSIKIQSVKVNDKFQKLAFFYDSPQIKDSYPIVIWVLKETKDVNDKRTIQKDTDCEVLVSENEYNVSNKRLKIQKQYNEIFRLIRQEALSLEPNKNLKYEGIQIKKDDNGQTIMGLSVFTSHDFNLTMKTMHLSIEIKSIKIGNVHEKIALFYDNPQIKDSSLIAIWLLKEATDKTGKKILARDQDSVIIKTPSGYIKKRERRAIQKNYIKTFRRIRQEALTLSSDQELIYENIQVKEKNNTAKRKILTVFSASDLCLYNEAYLSIKIKKIIIAGQSEKIAIFFKGNNAKDDDSTNIFAVWLLQDVLINNKKKIIRNTSYQVVRSNHNWILEEKTKYKTKDTVVKTLKIRASKGLKNNPSSLLYGKNRNTLLYHACQEHRVPLPVQNIFDRYVKNDASQVKGANTAKNTFEKKSLEKIKRQLTALKPNGNGTIDLIINNLKIIKDDISFRPLAELLGLFPMEEFALSEMRPKTTKLANPQLEDNNYQKQVIRLGLQDNVYSLLVQGVPGGGKTETMAELIYQYYLQGKSVLVISRMNEAIKNIKDRLEAYKSKGLHFLFAAAFIQKQKMEKAKEDLSGLIWDQSDNIDGAIIGATVDGLEKAPALKGKRFDVVIIEEAGSLNKIEAYTAALRAKEKVILAGDQHQTEPYFNEDEYPNLDLQRNDKILRRIKESILGELWDSGYNQAFIAKTYRCHPLISMIVSELIYNGKMVFADWRIIEQDTLRFRDIKRKITSGNELELNLDTNSSLDYRYSKVFKKCSELTKNAIIEIVSELRNNNNITTVKNGNDLTIKSNHIILNPFEAEEAIKEFHRAETAGYKEDEITILAGYNGQVSLIKYLLITYLSKTRKISKEEAKIIANKSVVTTDSILGKENKVVILSMTRSNKNPERLGNMNSKNRFNVGMTRAKDRIIILADWDTFNNASLKKEDKIFSQVVSKMEKLRKAFHDWIIHEGKGIFSIREAFQVLNKTLNEKILGNFTLEKPILNSMYTAFRNNELEDDVFKDFEYLHEMGVREENELYLSEEDFYLLSGLFEYEEYITLLEETSNLQGNLIKMTLQLNWLIDNNNRPVKIKLVKE